MAIDGRPEFDKKIDNSNLKVGIVHARWNSTVIDSLLKGTVARLKELGVKAENIKIASVPGSFELPWGVRCHSKHVNVIIAIGVLIKGESMHFEYISSAVTNELMGLQKHISKPVIFGLLTCLNEEQALKRSGLGQNSHNHGIDWANAAVEMAHMTQEAIHRLE